MVKNVFAVIALLLTCPAHAAGTNAADSVRVEATKALERMAKEESLPALSVAVAIDGKLVWKRAIGVSDLENDVAADPESRFRIGSVTKLLTAAAVARLHEQGKLDLDVPVTRYVKDLPEHWNAVTTRQLLGHLGGVRHYGFGDQLDHERNMFSPNHWETATSSLSIFKDDKLLSVPGEAYSYSSYGYNMIGAVLEAVSSKSFDEVIRDEVAAPLKLHATEFDDPHRLLMRRARSYSRRSGSLLNSVNADSCFRRPSGGFVSTAGELALFGDAHLRAGFLKRETLDAMFTSQKLADGKPSGTGWGWRIGANDDGSPLYHHGGALEGARAFLLVDPKNRITVAMLANVEAQFGFDQALEIARLFAPKK